MIVRKVSEQTGAETRLVLTPALLADISRVNGFVSADDVNVALERGERIYTSFSWYQKRQGADETYHWNTGCGYTANGQPMFARVLDGTRVVFVDRGRGIDGVVTYDNPEWLRDIPAFIDRAYLHNKSAQASKPDERALAQELFALPVTVTAKRGYGARDNVTVLDACAPQGEVAEGYYNQ